MKKMTAVMENVTKLVRANKFAVETVLYKVGEDAITDAFSRAADATDNTQVVLIFPTLQEELQQSAEEQRKEKQKQQAAQEEEAAKQKEEEERNKLKTEWLNLLFTDQSVAAMSPEGPIPITMEAGNTTNPNSLIVWVGDNPKAENAILKDVASTFNKSAFIATAWSQHAAGEAFVEFNLKAPEVVDGSFYLRDPMASRIWTSTSSTTWSCWAALWLRLSIQRSRNWASIGAMSSSSASERGRASPSTQRS